MPAPISTSSPPAAQSHRLHKKKPQPLDSQNSIKNPPCPHRSFPIVDLCILIAVLSACGFLLFPYLKLFSSTLSDFWKTTIVITAEEFGAITTWTYLIIGIGFVVVCSVLYLVVDYFAGQKCDNLNCRGLRNAPEFDIKIETEEDCLRILNNSGVESGFFELGEDYNRELGAKLKKMAPLNGRAVLIFRSKCGCSAGRMVVWGQKKSRKTKKMKASESDLR